MDGRTSYPTKTRAKLFKLKERNDLPEPLIKFSRKNADSGANYRCIQRETFEASTLVLLDEFAPQ